MKNVIFAAFMALGLISAPASANDFSGVRAEVTMGADDVIGSVDTADINYGAAIGFDAELYDNVIVGIEANVDNVFDRRNIGASARIGFTPTDRLLVYVKGGYSNWESITSKKLDGFRVGGGVDYVVTGPVYAGVEYRYSDFEGKVGQHGAYAKVGYRF